MGRTIGLMSGDLIGSSSPSSGNSEIRGELKLSMRNGVALRMLFVSGTISAKEGRFAGS